MSKRTLNSWMALTVLAALAASAPLAQGMPSWATDNANSCQTSCHTGTQTGRMQVVPGSTTINLGTQLDGSVRGSLKTYLVAPGNVVTLSVTVLNGASRYAVQFKRLEAGGQLRNLNNKLTWTANNAASNVWTKQQTTNPPYFTKDAGGDSGITWGGSPVTYTFDLLIGANTPPDFYDLVFATAGQGGDWYQEEHLYLEVLCPYSVAGDVNADCKVDILDLAALAQNWLIDCSLSPTNPPCVPK
jgi:hypothetical protein